MADIAALAELERASFAGDRISRESWRRLVRPGSHDVLITAGPAGDIAGCAVILFRKGSRTARLYSLAVGDKERGTGLGGMLLAAAEDLARRRGSNRMVLEVRVDAGRLVAWYAGRGYGSAGTRTGYYEDGGDALRMTKSMTSKAVPEGAPTQ